MKAVFILFLGLLLSIMYSCSSSEMDLPNPEVKQLKVADLKDLAKKCGYTDLVIDISRPLTNEDINFYRSLIINNTRTRGYIEVHMYLTELFYKGSWYTLRFDYNRDRDTGEVTEAYGGVYGENLTIYNDYQYQTIQTLFSRPEFMNNERFDIIIRAYYLTSKGYPYDGGGYDRHRYRIVIAAGLNVKTNTPTYQIHEEGEGEWPLEP